MVLQVVLWKWEQPGIKRAYLSEHVNIMADMLRRNLQKVPHRIICVTDKDAGITECDTNPLWPDFGGLANASGRGLPSCYRRLKLYDKTTQLELGIEQGDRIMGIDLDTLITGDIEALVRTEGAFVGWRLRNHLGKPVFNGSLQIFDAGTLQDVWDEFAADPKKAIMAAAGESYRGSDQAWLTYKLIDREGSVGLEWPLVASYPLQNRILGILKAETRIVFFHGSQKPWDPQARQATPWINRYWRQ